MATLTANITSSATILPVSAEIVIGYYTIDSEAIYVHGTSRGADGRDFDRKKVTVDRAVAGTTAATHSSGATLTRYYPEAAAAAGGGLTIVDGHTDIDATLNINAPAGASQDSALLTIVPDADWLGSGATIFVIVDPGGTPTENIGILEVREDSQLWLGAQGDYPIQINGVTGEIRGHFLKAQKNDDDALSTIVTTDAGATTVSQVKHRYDGTLIFTGAGGASIFEVRPDGSVHIKTGTSIVADL